MGKLAKHLHLGVRGALDVALERPTLRPGDVLRGTVRLEVTKPMERATLMVRVVGRETLRYMVSNGEGTTSHRWEHEHIVHEVLVRQGSNGGGDFGHGRFEFPIEYRLPMDAPPSFKYKCRRVEEWHTVRAMMAYVVHATLRVDALGTADLEDSAEFVVDPLPAASPRLHGGEPVHAQATHDIKLLGLFSSGQLGITMDLASDVYTPRDAIVAQVALAPETSRRVRSVRLILYEHVTLDRHSRHKPGKWGRRSGKRVVCQRLFDKAALGGVEDGRRLSMSLPITPNDIAGFEPLLPSGDRHFITLRYAVAVECSFMMSSRVKVHADVTIVNGQADEAETAASSADHSPSPMGSGVATATSGPATVAAGVGELSSCTA